MMNRRIGTGAALFALVVIGAAMAKLPHHPAHAATGGQSQSKSPANIQQVPWPTVTVSAGSKLPVGKEGIALTNHGGELYAVGGYTGSYSTSSVFEVSPTVRQVSTLPQPSHDSAAGFIGQDMFVFGGGQANSYNTLLRVTQGRTSSVGQLSNPLSDAVTVPWTDRGHPGLLLIGGYDGSVFNTTVRWYTEKDHHQLLSRIVFKLPVGVRYPAATASDSAVFVVGGLGQTSLSSAVYEWTPRSGIRTIAHLPVPIQKAAAFVWNSHLIVAGGYLPDGNPTSAIWDVRLTDHRVRQIGRLPIAVADMGYTQVGGTGYLLGGATTGGMNSTLFHLTLR